MPQERRGVEDINEGDYVKITVERIEKRKYS